MRKFFVELIGILFGILYGLPWIAGDKQYELTQMLLTMNFSYFTNFNMAYLTWFAQQLIPFWFFQMVYGIWLYQRFGTANVYFFTRHVNRKNWFRIETAKLFLHSFLFITAYTIGFVGISRIGNSYHIDLKSFLTLGMIILLEALFLFSFTLFINVISIWFNSMTGFLTGIGAQVVWIGSMLIFEMASVSIMGGWLFRLNPFSQIILCWHSDKIWGKANEFQISFPVWYSILYFILCICVIVKTGEWKIQRDILEESVE